ncbi:hypothetical protein DICVIV_01596 [Dictyocaulus viviparus]|uniref:Uncharacterized protein n=1 Tax=Dictyocaulus viviparus TaxID=29172 RepID=A0A0D8Y608_DICVI|nr:hypothetical protein DICVIV_01596 [Dictyocaulus viviparus]
MSILCGHQSRRPWPPANLLADFAGGGLTAAFGIVAALLKREKNGPQYVQLEYICKNMDLFISKHNLLSDYLKKCHIV